MMRYFIFNDVDSTVYNTYIASSNIFDSAQEDIDVVKIPGSNRVVYLSNGNFKPFIVKMKCYIPREMQSNVDELKQFLQSQQKICKLVDSLDTSVFRLARFTTGFSLDASDKQGAAFSLEFNARAEKFLTSGEEEITFAANGSITNPTLFPSKPLIRVYGNGTISIGEYSIITNNIEDYVDIDCDSQQAYFEETNMNLNVQIDQFPMLVSGENTITLDSVSKIDIIPRWWKL